jgi:diguanylate cyclase (GGDEF)-like protein/PAS domain S-box-containing protein
MDHDQHPPAPDLGRLSVGEGGRRGSYGTVVAAMGGTPAAADAGDDGNDAAMTPERLRYEREQGYFNDIYLLAPVAYFLLGLDTSILQTNLVGADLLGIARVQSSHYHFRAFVSARFLPDFDLFVRKAINTCRPERVQLQMQRHPHEQGFPVTLMASADSSGQAFRVVLELADGRLGALERSEERFRRIVHSAEEGIWEIDAAARTSFVNPKMARMLGYAVEEMLEQPLIAFMDDEGRAILERNIARRQQGVSERHEFKFMRKNGAELWTTLCTNPIFDSAGNYMGALALVSDITERKTSSEAIWRQANFDELSGLPNRHMFLDRLRLELKKAQREGRCLALLFVDLDHFKQVNDRLGHDAGDALLAEAARRMVGCVRASDTVARLGGDEFTVILSGLEQGAGAERIALDIVAELAMPFDLDEAQVAVSASVGIAVYPADAADIDGLLHQADQAMYAAKHAGRNGCSYFTPDMQAAAQLRLRAAADLRQALTAREFELHYQPIVNLHTGAIHRAEALLRWRHPQRGLLPPAEFMASAESSGLIVEIGDWVFRQAARQAKLWQNEIDPAFQISVNKSPVQFRGDVACDWSAYLATLDLAPRSMVIDISEDILLDRTRQVVTRLQSFRSMGMQVALDDFGTGYASLSHLRTFDIDLLKIDPSLLPDLDGDAGERALCQALVGMAHKLGIEVVAEGVETAAQRDALVAAGCDYAQGYVFAPALPADQFAALVKSGKATALA